MPLQDVYCLLQTAGVGKQAAGSKQTVGYRHGMQRLLPGSIMAGKHTQKHYEQQHNPAHRSQRIPPSAGPDARNWQQMPRRKECMQKYDK